MPFEQEFASYEPLRRISDNPKVQDFQNRLKIRSQMQGNESVELTSKSKLEPSDWQPDMILAIDGSYQAVKVENGFPGAELGYVTVASVLILLKKIRELEKQEFIDPRQFRETERASSIDSVYPGCNIIIDDEDSAHASMRKILFEELKNTIVFENGESLLETYEILLKKKARDDRPPQCPGDSDHDFQYGYGQYTCQKCNKVLYSTDAMRLHELHNPSGTCGEMYGQIMFTLERLWLIHILRAFERKNWLSTLRRMAFVMDGPLTAYGSSSWLQKPIMAELERINKLQKQINGQDLIIIGVEKSGNFLNHFEDIDSTTENQIANQLTVFTTDRHIKAGLQEKIPSQTAILLTDQYIKENILFSKSPKPYGQDTYFGRKFFYKTNSGYKIVVNIACFNDYQRDTKTAYPNQFPRLADVMSLLDQVVSSRYKNSVSPLVSAHAEAAIPLNLGKRIFEDIAREIRARS